MGHPHAEIDIFLPPQLARAAKPHQIGGIRFMYDNVVESLEQYAISPGFGCILAHSMGLGKTFQVCTFSEVFLRHTTARTVLVIVPINTIQNWVAEYNSWLPAERGPSEAPMDPSIQPRSFQLHVLNDATKDFNSRFRVRTIIFLFDFIQLTLRSHRLSTTGLPKAAFSSSATRCTDCSTPSGRAK